MADVFISYSRDDRAIAHELAFRLQAAGYSVFWDTNLLAGDDYRLVLSREMDAARAVIVIWTRGSVNSRLLRSEAQRAGYADKLLAVKARDLPLDELPVGLGTLHTPDLDRHDEILHAVARLVGRPPRTGEPYAPLPAGPATSPPPPRRGLFKTGISFSHLRIAFWSYAGVVGAVFTIVGNLDAAYKVARLARLLFEHWIDIITWVWRKIIFFRIDVLPEDAVYFTTLSLLFFNLLITSVSRDTSIVRNRSHYLNMTAMLLVICALSCVGFATKASGAAGGLINQGIAISGLRAIPAPWPADTQAHLLVIYGILLLLGVMVMFLLFVPIALLWQLQTNPQGFANRLVRIVVGVVLVIALNYSLLWAEDHPWIKEVFS